MPGLGAQAGTWEEVKRPSPDQAPAGKHEGNGRRTWSLLSSCASCWPQSPRERNAADNVSPNICEAKDAAPGIESKEGPHVCTVPPVDQSIDACKLDATEHSKNEAGPVASSQLRRFCFTELQLATRNFQPDSLLGKGGFGCVFKGWIDKHGTAPVKPGTGLTVAVKTLDHNGLQGHKEWLAEVTFLGQLHHPNLVKLIGFCIEDDKRLLVYEFMQRGSLENHLFRKGALPLPWNTRMKIALGAAKGVEFLHSGKRPVIYRDFKASNVLLDLEYCAKLSDFGLAKDGPEGDKTHVSTRVMGTQGYAAPEYVMTGHLSTKSDVYSFGIVLLEILTGKKSMDKSRAIGEHHLAEWARPFLMDRKKILRIVDPRLEGNFSIKGAMKVGQLASCCVRRDQRSRPSMSNVVQTLSQLQGLKDMASTIYPSEGQGDSCPPQTRPDTAPYQPKGF
ncbi:hypothetical protein GOP47_0009371 [Adiantum capillus-veneris]|uniref:non-specific serine/threonine protein kinase n=1 Tax=Adiantum capillus-veneris TaxID=13818 RepID=A0A9D4ZJL0_ADICA|nr:hypothetical protein GOP47_0009371 [Adiantum capillus-veneris]